MAKKNTSDRIESQETPIVRGNVNRTVSQSPHFQSLYANDVQLQTSPWDLRFTFSEMRVEPSIDGSPTAYITQLCDVRLSPPLAKRVLSIFAEQVMAYEARFGTIPKPADD